MMMMMMLYEWWMICDEWWWWWWQRMMMMMMTLLMMMMTIAAWSKPRHTSPPLIDHGAVWDLFSLEEPFRNSWRWRWRGDNDDDIHYITFDNTPSLDKYTNPETNRVGKVTNKLNFNNGGDELMIMVTLGMVMMSSLVYGSQVPQLYCILPK